MPTTTVVKTNVKKKKTKVKIENKKNQTQAVSQNVKVIIPQPVRRRAPRAPIPEGRVSLLEKKAQPALVPEIRFMNTPHPQPVQQSTQAQVSQKSIDKLNATRILSDPRFELLGASGRNPLMSSNDDREVIRKLRDQNSFYRAQLDSKHSMIGDFEDEIKRLSKSHIESGLPFKRPSEVTPEHKLKKQVDEERNNMSFLSPISSADRSQDKTAEMEPLFELQPVSASPSRIEEEDSGEEPDNSRDVTYVQNTLSPYDGGPVGDEEYQSPVLIHSSQKLYEKIERHFKRSPEFFEEKSLSNYISSRGITKGKLKKYDSGSPVFSISRMLKAIEQLDRMESEE